MPAPRRARFEQFWEAEGRFWALLPKDDLDRLEENLKDRLALIEAIRTAKASKLIEAMKP